ncbi:hypothetical protein PV10_05640 [Exophiala mesophila]|uniref:Uncharacterized protein n=1 Tax=Exophiala mesophila TaxID=212818 RepID=A0A0D1WPV2_EXOME|nr:uncharacterized protein PV10_05640 [Exophiala mesophila]KIV91055.1 hypothetical protein PV10_05640 [Exophiala mesophila]
MDGNDRRRSQYGQPYHTQAQSRPVPGQPMGPPSTDRYAQPSTPARSDIGRSSITRPYLPGYSGYGYQEQQFGGSHLQSSSPMQGVEMQYSPAYLQDPSRQQSVQASPSQQHHYTQYAQGSMLPPVGPQAVYDSLSFQQRQSAAIEVMASQLAVPQYMGQGEQAGVGVGSSSSHYMTTQAETTSYGNIAASRAPLSEAYGGAQGSFGGVEHTEVQSTGGQGGQEASEEGLREYRQQIRLIFDSIIAGRVTEASEKVVALSRWLVNSVTALGLHHDDESRHAERIELWQHINLCWEALGQKQKDITEEALRSRRQPNDVLSAEAITNLANELIGLCDQLEQYGLVDFEMGIWEEQIIHILTLCLDLLPHSDPGAQGSRGQVEPGR